MNTNSLTSTMLLAAMLVAGGCSSGNGGNGGTGGDSCEPVEERCASAQSSPIEPCCDLAEPPTQENACDGTESVSNPDSCDATGTTVTHRLTVFALDEECNNGFDLDGCDGNSCANGSLNEQTEGTNGVDNGLASSAPSLALLGEELDAVQQAFSNSLCGQTDDPERGTCDGGADDGNACTTNEECAGTATCDLTDNDCLVEIPTIDIELDVDANSEQRCANVTVRSGDVSANVILNLSAPTASGTACASGQLGDLPVSIEGKDGVLGNAVVRMTVSSDGFSDGLLGVTADSETATRIAEALPDPAPALVDQLFDINADLSADPGAACNALSLTMSIGGVAVQ